MIHCMLYKTVFSSVYGSNFRLWWAYQRGPKWYVVVAAIRIHVLLWMDGRVIWWFSKKYICIVGKECFCRLVYCWQVYRCKSIILGRHWKHWLNACSFGSSALNLFGSGTGSDFLLDPKVGFGSVFVLESNLGSKPDFFLVQRRHIIGFPFATLWEWMAVMGLFFVLR